MSSKAKSKKSCEVLFQQAEAEGRKVLLEHEAKELLRLHNAPTGTDMLAKSAEDAVKIAKDFGEKVVLKVVSPNILHKTEAGGVKLELKTEDEIRKAFTQIIKNSKKYNPKADIRGCLVSPMAEKGTEIIIGTKIDEQFGPVIMFGIGGILVEVVKDVSFRVLPISKNAAKKMIDEIKSAPILNGIRSQPPVDKKAIAALLMTVSEIIEAYPQILEMDLNPVIVYEHSISIVDARVIIK